MKSKDKTTQNTLRKTRNGEDVISLAGLSANKNKQTDVLILKGKHVPYFYAHILIHLYYRGQLILSDIGRLVERDPSVTWASLVRMKDLNLIGKDADGYYFLTQRGRNEVLALRSMLLKWK